MEKQSEAERLAAWLYGLEFAEAEEAGDELRRLDVVNEQLLLALSNMVEDGDETDKQQALIAIAAARRNI